MTSASGERAARVGLVTCAALPHGDDDEALLARELEKIGVKARWLVWSRVDPGEVAGEFDAVVIRSPWDYPDRQAAFLDWVETIEAPIFNEPSIVRWNSDKRYLLDLALAGVPTVATLAVEASSALWEPPADVEEFVVKPAIGAGSIGVGRYRHDEMPQARSHVDDILRSGRAALVQPYLSSVDRGAETAMVFVDGEFTHAVSKGPMLRRDEPIELVSGLYVAEEIAPRAATKRQLTIARQALGAVPEFTRGQVPLYARVDLVDDAKGEPMVLELELIEPSLFFRHAPGTAEAFGTAIARRLS